MPAIDTAIPDDRRQDVIDYVAEKYGYDHVANIVTFGTLGARQVIRDVGKVTGVSPRDIDMITRLIGSAPGVTDAIRLQPDLYRRPAADGHDPGIRNIVLPPRRDGARRAHLDRALRQTAYAA
ncbi:MAG: hypothetical protein IJH04_08390 [Eggerthellaceae bacterium]|nr:hypothetical protein [Eggerthellaceae bacterium]